MGEERQWPWLFIIAALLLTAGCTGSTARNLPMSPVSGKVSFKNALPHGQVVFLHPSGESAAVTFGPDGKYETQVAQGKNQVLVTSQTSSVSEVKEGGPKAMEIYTSHIPERYGNFATSKLEVEIKEGPNTFDINLEE